MCFKWVSSFKWISRVFKRISLVSEVSFEGVSFRDVSRKF